MDKKTLEIPEVLTVKQFAEKANLPVTAVISDLMKNGILATINQTIDFETACIVGDNLGFEIIPSQAKESIKPSKTEPSTKSLNLIPRPPVVTVMGHVDHGKTTLLDNIRKTHVASTESGGITQHISAYQVTLLQTKKDLKNKTITFIDTPGHAAFSAIREHGTAITDIVVLIVAADDGVMPQTVEVINQAQQNNVPIIVAINKVDLPDADIMRIKQQLSEYELVPEEWGGKTVMVEISAKTGLGIDDLLEMILLQADLMDLKADPDEKAIGVVIESHMQKGAGPLAVVLIENGTLRRGDPIASGSTFGKVRFLENYKSQSVDSAGPSMPVRVSGLKALPDFGEKIIAFSSEKEAKENATKSIAAKPTIRVATAHRISNKEDETLEFKELNLVLKCDVTGSLEAVKGSLAELNTSEYGVKVVAEGVGSISESDITLAKATGAEVVGFRINVLGSAKKIAEKEGVKLKTFQVIYELVDFVRDEISNILPPLIIEEELAKGKVLAIFRDDRKGFVAGGMMESGHAAVKDEIKFFQGENEKYRATIQSLRREKSEVKEIESGTEFGFGLPIHANVAVGDTFVVFKTKEQKRTLG